MPISSRPETTTAAESTPAVAGVLTSRRRKAFEFSLTLFAGIAILVSTLYFVDIGAVGEGLRKIGYGAATLAGLLALAQVFICALRWQIISRHTGATLRLRDTVLGYLEASFINAFLPTLIASDGARIFRAMTSGANAMGALVGVVTDRIVALSALAIAAAAGVIFLPGAIDNPWLLAAIAGILPALFLGLIAIDLMERYFVKMSHWRVVRPLLELAAYMRRLRQMPGLTVAVIGISLIGHMFCAGAFYILSQQLGMQIGYWAMFALSAPILVYAAVPITIGGWGIREAVTAALFGLVGYAPAVAVSLSIAFGLLMSAVGIICGIAAFLISIRRRALRLKNLSHNL